MILVGFMGSGKSTILNKLSKSGYHTLDLDRYIIETENISISEIFKRYGEEYFRKLEVKSLLQVSDDFDVIATGGGIVTTKEAREFIQNSHHSVLFLDAPFETLYDRIKGDEKRPLTRLDKEALKDLYDSRQQLYESVSERKVNATENIDVIVEKIIEWIETDKIK